MFYLFEMTYRFRFRCHELDDFSDHLQVIAENVEEAKNTIISRHSHKDISEFKLIKVTPITSPFITYMTTIPNQLYEQFEDISMKINIKS